MMIGILRLQANLNARSRVGTANQAVACMVPIVPGYVAPAVSLRVQLQYLGHISCAVRYFNRSTNTTLGPISQRLSNATRLFLK